LDRSHSQSLWYTSRYFLLNEVLNRLSIPRVSEKMLQLYNTLSRKKESFKPLEEGRVRMYVCGMTVYDLCHLGHARVMVVFDLIYKWLRALKYDVTYVRNITDIDDKIIQRAIEKNQSIQELTGSFIEAMNEDAIALGVEQPDHEPKATENIPQMLDLIQKLIDRGFAYVGANGDVYFSVRKFDGYGKLSGKSLDQLRAGERVGVDTEKQDPLDFVLWKSVKPGEPSWKSPWGDGRPGWHIECSAMSQRLLGEHFDIHGGGEDLQFPHHENEIAQSEGAHGCTFVNYWLHNGFVRVDEQKMSKSLGNFFTVREILEKFDAEVVRFFILRAHYRSPLNYSDQHLVDARQALTRLYTTLKNFGDELGTGHVDWNHPSAKQFSEALNDDFNTPRAISVLFELATMANRDSCHVTAGLLKGLANLVGLLGRQPDDFLKSGNAHLFPNDKVEGLIADRELARKNRDFKRADSIRSELEINGIILEDSAEGTTWRRGS